MYSTNGYYLRTFAPIVIAICLEYLAFTEPEGLFQLHAMGIPFLIMGIVISFRSGLIYADDNHISIKNIRSYNTYSWSEVLISMSKSIRPPLYMIVIKATGKKYEIFNPGAFTYISFGKHMGVKDHTAFGKFILNKLNK